MARTIVFIVLSLLFICSSFTYTHVQSTEEGFISIDIFNKGIDFVKDLLVDKAVSSLTPLDLPQIEKPVKIPVIGKVHIFLTNIILYRLDVPSSIVNPGDAGISVVASGATADLQMNWRYTYGKLIVISDKGVASVQVKGMEIGLTVGLKNQQGSIRLSLLECGCHVKDISIKLDGGASWLYQGLVDAFEGKIRSAVEDAISTKIGDEIINLDSQLQSLPKEIPIDNIAALNVTFVNDPVLSPSSVELEIDGLFTPKDEIVVSNHDHQILQTSVSCTGPDKMVGILLHENVLNSASFVYFNANLAHLIVDEMPDQSLLNTAGWRYFAPQLYEQYPNDDMSLNISVSSPPIIKIEKQKIDAMIHSDVTIGVLDAGEVIPVACISLVISASASPEISRNNLAGRFELKDFTMSLKWSTIGNLHMHLVQSVVSAVLETVIVPCVNIQLERGFPLPKFRGYTLQNAQILCADSRVVICSDVASIQPYNINQLPVVYE